jgi:methyl-accepting chemotaxis protein
MGRTEERISAGVDTVETSIDALERLAEASERTDTSMTEITRATETQANSVDAVVGHVEDVSAISAQTASAAGEVTGAVDEQEQTLSAVETAAGSLSERAIALRNAVDDFEFDAESGFSAGSGVADDGRSRHDGTDGGPATTVSDGGTEESISGGSFEFAHGTDGGGARGDLGDGVADGEGVN